MRTLLSICILVILGDLCGQTTWYIATTGSDSNSGLTPGEAFFTVDQAIGLAACGDSILVLGGIYHEKINAYLLCPDDNRVVVQGDTTDRPVFIGDSTVTNRYAIGATGSGFVFRHLELTSPFPNECSPSNMVVVGSGDYFDFIDIIVHHSGYDGIKTTSNCESDDFPVGWRIIDSEVHSNGLACPASIVNGDGIDLTRCRDCSVDNTLIRDNMGHQIQVKLEARNVSIQHCHIEGIHMLQIGLPGNTPQCDPAAFNADSVYVRNNTMLAKGDTSGFVIRLADVSNLYIENNTIVKDSVMVDVGFICFGGCASDPDWQNSPSAPSIIRNNIFYSRASLPFYAGPDTTFFNPLGALGTEVSSSYNLFFDINGSYVVPPDNNPESFVADPLFCDYPNGFELSEASPCIDSGDPGSINDPDLSQNDIGAIYFQAPCAVSTDESDRQCVVDIFPNPNSGSVTMVVPEDLLRSRLELYNSLGRMVKAIPVRSKRQRLDLRLLSSGMYYYRVVMNDSGTVSYGKLMKKGY